MTKIDLNLGNVYSVINSKINDEVISKIENICSYNHSTYDPGLGYKRETRISLFNKYNLTFPSGLYQRVYGELEYLGYKVNIKDNRSKPNVDIDKIISRFDEFGLALRDYQIDGGIAGIENPRGLFNWSTGAGKTVLFVFLLLAYDVPTLILVNRKELMEQIAREISNITGRSVGTIGDGVWNPNKWTVAIVNTLNKSINSNSVGTKSRVLNYLKTIQMFIGDEIHHLGAKTWKDIAKACEKASVRFGFSGTCFHPDSEDLYLVAFTGEIISDISPSKLIKDGWLAKPYIYMPEIISKNDDDKKVFNWHQVKKVFIRENEAVNESGVNFIKKMYDKGITSIYFSGDDIILGKKIYEMLIDSGINYRDIKFMTGSESSDVRRKTLTDFRNKKIKILGGTSIYDEGVDVPHVGAGANFGQGASEIKTVQRIGRILRKTKEIGRIDVDPNDKQIKYYWDPYNLGHKITEKHSEFRYSIYRRQQEFKIFNEEYDGKK